MTGNTSCGGGGIGTVNGGSTTIINSTITANSASSRGGGIINRTGGTTIISGTLITGNSTGGPGGAIHLDDGTMTISQSCIVSNNGDPDVSRSSGTLTADGNWWGVVTGPNTGGETTNVSVTNFLTSPPPCGASLSVTIDIKPGSFPNSINPRRKVNIPVVILTTEDFDATTVDPLSVEFGPDDATESHSHGHIEDVDSDGDDDLVLHFRTQDTGIQCGDTSAALSGETFGGQAFEGSDSINTMGC